MNNLIKKKYLIELKNKFNSDEFNIAINSFEKYKLSDYKQFVNDGESSDLYIMIIQM